MVDLGVKGRDMLFGRTLQHQIFIPESKQSLKLLAIAWRFLLTRYENLGSSCSWRDTDIMST